MYAFSNYTFGKIDFSVSLEFADNRETASRYQDAAGLFARTFKRCTYVNEEGHRVSALRGLGLRASKQSFGKIRAYGNAMPVCPSARYNIFEIAGEKRCGKRARVSLSRKADFHNGSSLAIFSLCPSLSVERDESKNSTISRRNPARNARDDIEGAL
jgi:hypothetical protein